MAGHWTSSTAKVELRVRGLTLDWDQRNLYVVDGHSVRKVLWLRTLAGDPPWGKLAPGRFRDSLSWATQADYGAPGAPRGIVGWGRLGASVSTGNGLMFLSACDEGPALGDVDLSVKESALHANKAFTLVLGDLELDARDETRAPCGTAPRDFGIWALTAAWIAAASTVRIPSAWGCRTPRSWTRPGPSSPV